MTNRAYIRVSTKEQTVENQRLLISKQYDIAEWYTDAGVSGEKPAMKRGGMRKLFAEIQPGDTLYIAALDRMGRSIIDVWHTIEWLLERDIKIVSIKESFDLSTAVGKMIAMIFISMAQMERERLISRTNDGLDRARSEGKQLGRPAKHHAEILQLRNEGASLGAISNQLGVCLTTVKKVCRAAKSNKETEK
jgi:DNA invertase Pin-like site-specific DNA recombinase